MDYLHSLDSSVGESGPHAFAVRFEHASSHAPFASIASAPRFVTIGRNVLLWEHDGGSKPYFLLFVKKNLRIFGINSFRLKVKAILDFQQDSAIGGRQST